MHRQSRKGGTLNQIFEAFHRAEQNFFSRVSYSQIEYNNMVAYATGVQACGLNPAIVSAIDNQFIENVIKCQAFYAQNKLPWALILPDYLYAQRLEAPLQEQHLEVTDKGVAMIASLSNSSLPIIDSALIVKEIKGNLSEWSVPLIYGFESTPEVTAIYTKRHESASKPDANLHHFSGFINNTLVTSLTLSLCEDFARIDDVATLPAYQRKGYATTLILETLRFAKQLNVTSCFLEASETGLNVYKKLGFNELFINLHYEQGSPR